MLGPIRTQAREKYIDFSLPAFPPVHKIFLVNREQNIVRSYDDLRGKLIGVQRGSRYFDKFDQDEKLNKLALNNYSQVLKMLKANRIDIAIIPEPIAQILLRELDFSFIRSPLFVPGEVCYIAVSKKSPLKFHMDKLSDALDKVKKSGQYDKVIEKYLQ